MTKTEALKRIREVEAWSGVHPLASGHTLFDATREELDELIAHYADLLAAAEREAEEATRYRPSYAPAGRLTRSEQSARIVVSEIRKLLVGCQASRLLAINDIPRR